MNQNDVRLVVRLTQLYNLGTALSLPRVAAHFFLLDRHQARVGKCLH
jgi:hypothetical protein